MDKRILILLLANILYVLSSPHLQHIMNKREVFCGSKLSETLRALCGGRYNSPAKKSFNDFFNYNEYEDMYGSENDDAQLEFPFMQKETANSIIPMRFRRRGGIVDECCHKPCTIKHLSLYCA